MPTTPKHSPILGNLLEASPLMRIFQKSMEGRFAFGCKSDTYGSDRKKIEVSLPEKVFENKTNLEAFNILLKHKDIQPHVNHVKDTSASSPIYFRPFSASDRFWNWDWLFLDSEKKFEGLGPDQDLELIVPGNDPANFPPPLPALTIKPTTPLILIDVDGCINRSYRYAAEESDEGKDRSVTYVKEYEISYHPEIIQRINAWTHVAEVKFLTMWFKAAQTALAPKLRINNFSHMPCKKETLAEYLRAHPELLTRPIVWIDDELHDRYQKPIKDLAEVYRDAKVDINDKLLLVDTCFPLVLPYDKVVQMDVEQLLILFEAEAVLDTRKWGDAFRKHKITGARFSSKEENFSKYGLPSLIASSLTKIKEKMLKYAKWKKNTVLKPDDDPAKAENESDGGFHVDEYWYDGLNLKHMRIVDEFIIKHSRLPKLVEAKDP